jgi:hypothetical protein
MVWADLGDLVGAGTNLRRPVVVQTDASPKSVAPVFTEEPLTPSDVRGDEFPVHSPRLQVANIDDRSDL